jgi:hypothetical protein
VRQRRAARRSAGPLRLQLTAADDADLAVRGAGSGRPQHERPGLDRELHRVQLGPALDLGVVRSGPVVEGHPEGIPSDLAGLFEFSNCNVPAGQLDPKTGQVAMSNSHLHGDNQGSDWANGDLSGSKIDGQIQGTFAKGANLSGADLPGVQAQGSDFSSANLTGANLQHAQLQGANFSHADLTNANLRDAKTSGASFTGAKWSNTTCPDGTNSDAAGHTCQLLPLPTWALIETDGPRRYGRCGPVRSST